jgi:large subunit ribosomal protein L4
VKLPVYNAEGKEVRKLDVDESVFGIEPNAAVLHQAYVAQRANQRMGTAATKSRGEVRGSTRKIRMQKYTGRARAGSARSPTRVGGGIAFGPKPRDYSQALPKKMRRLAIRSALSGKVADGELFVVDGIGFEAPKTKEMLRVLRNVGIQRSALIVTGEPDRSVLVSARNLEKTKVLPAAYLNVVDMMHHKSMLMTEDAVRTAERLWGGRAKAPAVTEEKPRRRAAAKEEAPAAEEEKPRRRAAAKAEAPAAEEEKKPRRRAAPKAEAAGEEPKPRRRSAKAEAAKPEAGDEKKPARRTARKKTEEGEG